MKYCILLESMRVSVLEVPRPRERFQGSDGVVEGEESSPKCECVCVIICLPAWPMQCRSGSADKHGACFISRGLRRGSHGQCEYAAECAAEVCKNVDLLNKAVL